MAAGELVDHELHPQLRRLVLDDEGISSWCDERGRRREQRGKLQVAAVRRVGGELGDVAGSSLLMR